MQPDITRREVLIGIGTATVAGGAALATSDTASAQTDVSGLDVADLSHVTDGETITDAILTVNATWSYDASQPPSRYELVLEVSQGGSVWASVDSASVKTGEAQASGTTELSGSLFQTSQFDTETFVPAEGGTKTHRMYARLSFRVFNDAQQIAGSQVQDVATVEVTNDTLTATMQLSGDGEVTIQSE